MHFTPFPLTRKFLSAMRGELALILTLIGHASLNTVDCLRHLRRLSKDAFLRQMSVIGVDSLGIALVMTTFFGMVIALQVADEMVKQGGGNFVGALVSLALVRELAPILTAFSVIALAGSAMTAEMATMKITEQVDALKVLHVHPARYLILPRVLAAIVALPLLTVLTTTAGILGGMVVSFITAELPMDVYLESVWHQTQLRDVFTCLLKAGVFGYLLAMLGTTIGLQTQGGAREVGVSTTRAVVWSFVWMAIADYLLTFLIYGGMK
jgi:phospholipid/cholesterol/gamma-HCH transport system permease protein